MATQFAYTVRDAMGGMQTGKIEADSADAVERALRAKGYIPLEITEAGGGMQKEIRIGGAKKVKTRDLAVFTRQFAVMIDSGLSLLRSLQILSEQSENPTLRATLRDVRADVENGSTLSASFAKFPMIFPPIMINMVRAGEMGGFLDSTMLQIAQNFEAEARLKGKIKAALTYPIAVGVIAILITVGMLVFVVPTFKNMFEGLGGELPLPTQVLVMLSENMRWMLPILIVGSIAGGIAWGKNKHKEGFRNVVDPLKLKLPVFGNLIRKVALARFSRNFSTLLSSGVPILQALDIVGDTSGNQVITNAVKDVRESVRSGETLSRPLSQHEVFPPMIVQMMAVGEDTGSLDQMLEKVADFYDTEVEATTEQLTALIEPIMIAVLGGLVGAMIIALYMPIFKVFDLIGG